MLIICWGEVKCSVIRLGVVWVRIDMYRVGRIEFFFLEVIVVMKKLNL